MAGHQITFRVDDDLFESLVAESSQLGTSPHILAKEIVQGRYGGARTSPAAALGAHFTKQYLGRMQEAIRAVTPELTEIMERLAHEVMNDRAWGGPGQGGRPLGTARPKRQG